MVRRRPKTVVPRHESEVVRSAADRYWRGDSEKVPTTSVRHLQVRSVQLSSRYDKAHELDTMAAAVESLEPAAVSKVVSIFCNSKACAVYSVEVRDCPGNELQLITARIEHALIEAGGGHNGIDVHDGKSSVFLDPDWGEG